jgi:hypothetical protein
MFTTIITNNVSNVVPLLNHECVTIKLFGLSTKILASDIAVFFVGLVVTIMLAEMLANYMITNIEELKKKKDLRDVYLKQWKERNERKEKKEVNSKIIQCDKCYNEYAETEIKKIKIIGNISQQYCGNCYNFRSEKRQGDIRKSQSDSKLNYNYTNK